jgi:hypothetical protein
MIQHRYMISEYKKKIERFICTLALVTNNLLLNIDH